MSIKTSKLLKRAAEPEATEQPDAPAFGPEVLKWVGKYPKEVFRADKEVPETFPDLHPIEGQIDPTYFYVPDALSGSRLNKEAVNIGNYRVFLKRYQEVDGVCPVTGDHGSFGVAIRISSISAEMLDDLKSLEDYPSMDDTETSQVEHEQIDEAWNDWAHYDFIRALENQFPEHEEWIDALDDDQARELFDRVRERQGIEWSPDSTGPFIDVFEVAAGVTESDIHKDASSEATTA